MNVCVVYREWYLGWDQVGNKIWKLLNYLESINSYNDIDVWVRVIENTQW